MYQSNQSFNIPPTPPQLPGHLNFWKIIVQIPPRLTSHWAEKLFKCPHPWENYHF